MKNILLATLAVAILSVAFVSNANACSRKSVRGENQVIVAGNRINASLLDATMRVEVNYHRCRAGLRPVRSEKRLRKIATGHSNWMAKAHNMTHRSTVRGRRTMVDRIKRSGLRWKAAVENIGMVYRYRMEKKQFFIKDAASCQFRNSSGKPIPPHSYKSLARYIVGLWMESPSHRHNILDRRMRMVGTAISLDKKAKFCGTFYITQNLAQ